MEQTKAEGLVWHKNCFRCVQCSKQLSVDNYESHESTLYCKPHFKELFQPKPVEESDQPGKSITPYSLRPALLNVGGTRLKIASGLIFANLFGRFDTNRRRRFWRFANLPTLPAHVSVPQRLYVFCSPLGRTFPFRFSKEISRNVLLEGHQRKSDRRVG